MSPILNLWDGHDGVPSKRLSHHSTAMVQRKTIQSEIVDESLSLVNE
jgi:hypothetical protein